MGVTNTLLKTSALALAANMAFADLGKNDSYTDIDWNQIVKDPIRFTAEPTLPTQADDRITVSTNNAKFNNVGRILYGGNNHCSGNVIEVPGYHTTTGGILVSTAAHCLTPNILPSGLTFSVNYENADGEIEYRSYANPQTWYNPAFHEINDSPSTDSDQAFLFFPNTTLPEEIKPATLTVSSRQIMRDFGIHELRDITFSSAGYSSDMSGLSEDANCRTRDLSRTWMKYIVGDCKLYKGASGSGLIVNEDDNNNSVTIAAITSAVSRDTAVDDESFFSYFAPVYHNNLAQVPFLKKDDVCARVTAPSGLRVRTENYHDSGSAYAKLDFNQVVLVTDMLYDAQEKYGPDDVWLEIRTLDNPDPTTPNGFSNSAWLEETPCPSWMNIKF